MHVTLAEIGSWAQETIPKGSDEGILNHIAKELQELREEPDSAEEMADIVILVAHFAARRGVDLEQAISEKHAINLLRTWKKPDEFGVVEHVK